MARPRGFDTEELLDDVGLVFLETGFQLTSMRQLEKSTGVKQVSLYNAFGSKEGLFLAAFDRYTALIEETQCQFLDDRGLDGIEAFVKAIVSTDSPLPLPHFGCLIVNTALVAGEAGPAIKLRVAVFRRQMHQRFVAALSRARDLQQLDRGLDLEAAAEFLLSAVWGIFVTIRLAGDGQSVGRPAAHMVVETLRGWAKS